MVARESIPADLVCARDWSRACPDGPDSIKKSPSCAIACASVTEDGCKVEMFATHHCHMAVRTEHYGNSWCARIFMWKVRAQRRKGSSMPALLINISSLRHATRHGHAQQVCQFCGLCVGWRTYSNVSLVQTSARMGQILIYVRRVSFCCLVYNPYEPTAHAPDKDGQASATDFAKVLRRQRRRADLLSFRVLCELRILLLDWSGAPLCISSMI